MGEYGSPFLSHASFFFSLWEDACTTLLRTDTIRRRIHTATIIPMGITNATMSFPETAGGTVIRIMVIVTITIMGTEAMVPEGDKRLPDI